MINISNEIEQLLMTKRSEYDIVATLSIPEHKFKKISDKLNDSIISVYNKYNVNGLKMSDIILELRLHFEIEYLVDKLLPHLHMGLETSQAEGVKTNWQRSVLLVLAITLHNIPEGLAVGVAFGAVAAGTGSSASLAGAVALAIGIGLQNFPEGAAVSIPLRREGFSRTKSFLYGQASGIVEPIAGVIGAFAVVKMQPILPYALAFAAGAMIYVVIEELIPEAQREEGGSKTDIATIGCMIGFTIMMVLDVALA